jgi:hypothetical protein
MKQNIVFSFLRSRQTVVPELSCILHGISMDDLHNLNLSSGQLAGIDPIIICLVPSSSV